MANVKSRLKAHRGAAKRKKGGKTKKLDKYKTLPDKTGNEETAIKQTTYEVVMRRPSNKTELLTTTERVHMLVQNGHLLKDKFALKTSSRMKKPLDRNEIDKMKDMSEIRDRLITKSGRIVKKSKDHLKFMDNILKSELMISEMNKKKTSEKETSTNNNNDKEITDQNEAEGSQGSSKKLPEKKKEKTSKIRPAETKQHPEVKQVTLTNGVVLTVPEYECDTCRKTFSNKSSLRRHMYIHLGIKPYSCPFCKKIFYDYLNMQSHVSKDHEEVALPTESYLCHICDQVFQSKEDLALHLSCHINSNVVFKCIYCNEQFSHQLLLTRHEALHLVGGRYCCTVCPMTYESRYRLDKHIRSHLNIKEHICQFCGKDFLRMNSMKRHVNISHGGQRIQCPICKKKLKGHLTEHMRTHEKRRPHACPECGQCFTQSTQLNVHRRSHTGDRPYHCRICDRRFSHSNALMLHVRRHTGEKPFPCAVCPLAFSQLPHMKAHMRKIHKKDNPYKCLKCNQFFKFKAHIANHAKICKAGEKELSFEEKIQASVQIDEEVEVVESAMSLSRMRFLLALLFTMIASKEKLKYLGFNKRLIDDVLIESLEAMGQKPCKDESLQPIKRLKINIELMLKHTIPKEQIEKFEKENKTTEELLELLTDEKKSE